MNAFRRLWSGWSEQGFALQWACVVASYTVFWITYRPCWTGILRLHLDSGVYCCHNGPMICHPLNVFHLAALASSSFFLLPLLWLSVVFVAKGVPAPRRVTASEPVTLLLTMMFLLAVVRVHT